jgi:STE24 endopeptidase
MMMNDDIAGGTPEPAGRPDKESGSSFEQESEKAKEYNREKRILFVAELIIGFLFLVILLFTGLSLLLARRLESVANNPWLVVLLYISIIGAAYELIGLPLEFYGGYILEHRYGQSTQTLWVWVWDQMKGLLVSFVLGVPLMEILYWLLRAYPQTWWLIAAILFIVFAVIMANLAPVLLLPIFYKVIPLRDEELKRRIVALCEKVGTKVKGVYEMDMSRKTRAANAALVGIANTRRIILGDTLLEKYEPDEVESVLAHELGHHKHADIWKGLFFQSGIIFIGFYLAYVILRAFSKTLGFEGPADIAAFPLLVLTSAVVSLVFLPVVNGFSRRLERSADEFALQSTRNPRAFISMMSKLGRQNLAEFEPNRLIELLLFSHPPIKKRIEHAYELFPESMNSGEKS